MEISRWASRPGAATGTGPQRMMRPEGALEEERLFFGRSNLGDSLMTKHMPVCPRRVTFTAHTAKSGSLCSSLRQ